MQSLRVSDHHLPLQLRVSWRGCPSRGCFKKLFALQQPMPKPLSLLNLQDVASDIWTGELSLYLQISCVGHILRMEAYMVMLGNNDAVERVFKVKHVHGISGGRKSTIRLPRRGLRAWPTLGCRGPSQTL